MIYCVVRALLKSHSFFLGNLTCCIAVSQYGIDLNLFQNILRNKLYVHVVNAIFVVVLFFCFF